MGGVREGCEGDGEAVKVWAVTLNGHICGVVSSRKRARDFAFRLAGETPLTARIVYHGPFTLDGKSQRATKVAKGTGGK